MPKGKNEWLLFLTGINLMLLHFIFVQHVSVAIRQAEIAVIVFSLSYFSGISLGYFVSDRVSRTWIRRLFPAFLVGYMVFPVIVQFLVYVVTRDVGNWANEHGLPVEVGKWTAYTIIFFWITIGATSLYSIFLPSVIEAEDGRLQRCYSIEVAGSVLGLLLLPLLSGISHVWLLAGYFVTFLGMGMALDLRRDVLLAMGLFMVGYLGYYDSLDKHYAGMFYRHWYSYSGVERVEYTRYTPYHKIEILRLDDGEYMLLLNGKRQFARGSHYTYSYFVAEYPARLLDKPTVCLLGCGSMSTVGRIGDFVGPITIVDLDSEVFSISRRFFQKYNRLDRLDNWVFVADDAKHYLANGEERFDLILHDIPPARSRQTALTYTAEFFSLVKARLTSRGIFSISALRAAGADSDYSRKMLATLAHVFDRYFVLAYRGSYYFYGGGTGMQEFDKERLQSKIQHSGKDKVRVLDRPTVDALVRSATIITTNNVGDLIYD